MFIDFLKIFGFYYSSFSAVELIYVLLHPYVDFYFLKSSLAIDISNAKEVYLFMMKKAVRKLLITPPMYESMVDNFWTFL